jgi:hypothetical protein
MATLAPYISNQYFLDDGTPNNAGTLSFYEVGGAYSVLKDIYSDAAGTVDSNPKTMGADGRVVVYLGEGPYDVVVKNSDGDVLDTIDNVINAGSSGESIQYVETIALLRALEAGSTTYVDVGGNLANGDGGGGRMHWNSTQGGADNGLTQYTPDSSPATGRWMRTDDFQTNRLYWNAYDNDGDYYLTTAVATRYDQNSGVHSFRAVTSGTKDTAITWVTPFTIDVDGTHMPDDKILYLGSSDRANVYWSTSKPNDSLVIRSNYDAGNDIYIETMSGQIYFQPNDTAVLNLSNSAINVADAKNITFGTSTGTEIGTAANQKIGIWGATPVTQLLKANYNNWAAFGDVVDALVAVGLFDQA